MGTLLNRRRYMGGGIEYFPFEDAEVWKICCTNWGDYNEVVITDNGNNTVKIVTTFYSKLWKTTVKSRLISSIIADNSGGEYVIGTTKEPIGITINQIQAISGQGENNYWHPFAGNTLIETFNEFQYFTGLANMRFFGFFKDCTNLREIILPDEFILNNNDFLRNTAIESLVIPSGSTTFRQGTVYTCTHLTYIQLPEGITSMSYRAAYGCSSLTEITIPSTVTYIANVPFQNCSNLRTIKILATTPPTLYASTGSNSSFGGLPSDYKIYVPDSALGDYQTADKWTSLISRLHPLSDLNS